MDEPLRVGELSQSNSSRYDFYVVAPSNETLHIMWSIYATCLWLFVLFTGLVLGVMLSNAKIRSNAFNLYLIFLTFPDVFFSATCAAVCTTLAIRATHYDDVGLCHFQSFVTVFGLGANGWVNAVIAHEVHKMLRLSKRGHRYFPPSRRIVIRNSLLCYAWALFVASWSLWGDVTSTTTTTNNNPLPHNNVAVNGIMCMPGEYSTSSSIFYWLVFAPSFMIIPLVYVCGVCLLIFVKQLLPPSGRGRQFSIYFFRIMAVFIIFWFPCLVAICVTSGRAWVTWLWGFWGHLQGLASAIVISYKKDVNRALKRYMMCCGEPKPQDRCSDEETGESSLTGPASAEQDQHHEGNTTAAMAMTNDDGVIEDPETTDEENMENDLNDIDFEAILVQNENYCDRESASGRRESIVGVMRSVFSGGGGAQETQYTEDLSVSAKGDS